MSESNAPKSIRQALYKSGANTLDNEEDPKINATMVRELITTLVREDPELAGPISQQLNHSEATGEGTYQLEMKQNIGKGGEQGYSQ